MVKLGRWVAALVVMGVVLMPLVAVATPPTQDLWVDEYTWEFENNPCTEANDPFVLEVTVTQRDIIFWEGEGGKVVTTVRQEITGPEPWSGRGTQTIVQHNGEQTLSWQFVATNADAGEKVRFHANARFPEFGGIEWGPPFGLFCVRP